MSGCSLCSFSLVPLGVCSVGLPVPFGWLVTEGSNSSEKLRSLMKLLPSKTIFDLGVGNDRMRWSEGFGSIWRGSDQSLGGGVSCWDLAVPCPTSEKAGAALSLDVIEHCMNPGLGLKISPTL
jgi:hypothetical protein